MRWRLGRSGPLSPAVAAALVLLSSRAAHPDGVAEVLTSKTLPPATIALIDPESGTSSGGGTTDVKVAVGDVITFRFRYFPVPDKIVRGLQGYLTEFVPPNTEVVGVRLIDDAGLTIRPRFPGIAPDGCGRPCPGYGSVPSASGSRSLSEGSISQLYADTGVFYATAGTLARNPGTTFITLQNGIVMNPEPRNVSAISGLLGASSPLHIHDAWDWTQVRAFGITNPQGNASGNGGQGNTPFGYGSPVAGPETFYGYEATEVSPGVIQFNDQPGPWRRIRYPGAQTGSGSAATGTGSLRRTNVATGAGHDLTPANPLPAGTRAVRWALGEMRVGEPGMAEIALRVKGTPLDSGAGKDMDCAETFGGDTSAASDSVRARDNPWPTHLASPACVYLNLLFDLDVDKRLARTGETLTYTLHGKNLSLNQQTGAVAKLKYDSNDVSYVAGSASGNPTQVGNCDGDGKACLVWPAQTLAPSAEYTHTARFTVGGSGHVTNVMFARYHSDQLPAPGFTTQALTVVREISVVRATLQAASSAAAGGRVTLTGTVSNQGSGAGNYDTITAVLPTGWTVAGPVTLGSTPLTCSSGCTTNRPTFGIGSTFAAGDSRTLSFEAAVPAGTAAGLYPVDLQIWASQSMFGGAFETYFPEAALVPVGGSRSPAPTVTCPVPSNATSITGTTTAPDGTVVRLYFNGLPRGEGTASGGRFTVTNFVGFGSLYAGLEVRATATAPGQLESELGPACFVSMVPVCSDGRDNDGDGRIDFPADLGCTSPSDSDERDSSFQCSDGMDNDGDGLTDFPADPGCSSGTDPTEGGAPECSDGLDNDGDGLVDHPTDPGCSGAGDSRELDLAACQDGLDNDADGRIDFPADPGCHSGFDASETDPALSEASTKPRMLIAFDSSGSMNTNTCNDQFTGGDGSWECPGDDLACSVCSSAGCGDGMANDSRMFKVKSGVSDVLRAFGEVDFSLMRFHQRPESFMCPTAMSGLSSGGWQGGGAAPCAGGFDAGDLLVSFGHDNRNELLGWMDGRSNYPGTPPPGMDHELRGSGTTPIAGILRSALAYLQSARAADSRQACRPLRVILVTDGAETCGGNPAAEAAALLAQGIRVHVIGFATTDATTVASLDAIAAAGGTSQAVRADDAAALSAAMARIISESILVERCNGADDDCDGLVDEDFPDLGNVCGNGKRGVCLRMGTRVCTADGLGTMCTAGDGTGTAETCPPNRLDDDCNGVVDDVPGGCPTCTPEICNGLDDDCDGSIDESADLFPCPGGAAGSCAPACGSSTGSCRPGLLACQAGRLECVGSTGPSEETCDGQDNDCNGIIDGFSRPCYPGGATGCDVVSRTCTGNCRFGAQICPRLTAAAASNAFGMCLGAITPEKEICNGLDDDCDGVVDDVPGGCENICIPRPELCNGLDDNCDGITDNMPMGEGDDCVVGYDAAKAGVGLCRPGKKVCVAGAFQCHGEVGPQPEICDGKDNDCDGTADVQAACPTGFACSLGGCQPLCGREEFACVADRSCVDRTTGDPCLGDRQGCVCIPNPCLSGVCDPASQTCKIAGGQASCVNRCQADSCPAGASCNPADGSCRDCRSLGCPVGELCAGSPPVCRPDACHGVSCGAGQICVAGQCRGSCQSVTCPTGQRCTAGVCSSDRCAGVACVGGTVCDPETGTCAANLCSMVCVQGKVCVPRTGACVDDPCQEARCGACASCRVGFDGTPDCVADARCGAVPTLVTRDGCACALGARPPGQDRVGGPWLLGLALLVFRRRRRGGR